MKKIIHVIGGGEFGGAEQHILDLLSQLPLHQIQAKVVCFYEAGLSKALRERGIEVEVLQYGRFDFRLLSGLRQLYFREKPDVVHTHGVKANFFGRLAARGLAGTKLVTTVHSVLKHDYSGLAYRFASAMERMTRKWNHHYIAVSHAIEHHLVDSGISANQITVVHHGIDTALFSPETSGKMEGTSGEAAVRGQLREQWDVPQDAFVIGVVGRLVTLKNVDNAIRALHALVSTQPNTYLVIVGDGPELAPLESLTHELGLVKQVKFLGFRRDIYHCMRAFDCFVSASLSEGLGLNVLEAMATELPVVVTGVGGILDFTEDRANGLLIEPRSVEALTKHIRIIMSDRPLAERLAQTARKRVVESFSLYSMGVNTANVYEQLVKEHRLYTKKLVISGYYGFGNNGDEAVLSAILLALEQQAQQEGLVIKPVVLSIHPEATTRMHGVEAVHRLKPIDIIRTIRESDGLISGGGSLLQDLTGLRTIPYYICIIKLAQWLKKPTFIYSQGLGPIAHSFYYPLIRSAFKRSQLISVRDEVSLQLIDKLGMQSLPVTLAADPVMGLSVGRGQDDKHVSGASSSHGQGEAPVIGIAVRKWQPGMEDLLKITEALRRILAAKPKAVLHFLPFHPPKDIEAAQFVMKQLGSVYRDRMVMCEHSDDPKQMLELVESCDLVIGMRLHSLIYAAICKIPMIGIAYDPKIDHFLRQLGMEATGTTTEMNSARIADQALELLDGKNRWVEEKASLIEELKIKSKLPAQQICQYLRIKKRLSQ